MNSHAFDGFLSDRIRMLMHLRGEGITDTVLLSAIEKTPREIFIPHMFQDKAYADIALPIESGQTISQPSVVAWMTAALDVSERMRVLEIGTGSGYQAAVLSRLCRRVYTIERHKNLMELAEQRFKQLALPNITTRVGDGTKGWHEAAPYDRILVTAAASEVPAALLEQLSVGGVMVIPVGDPSGEQILLRIERDGDGYSSQHLMNVRFVPLIEGKILS
jgi:protein-L-isoaspartate(D-aspartate) O-methyltransferase